MKIAASTSNDSDSARAIAAACAEISKTLGKESADLVMLFISSHHTEAAETILASLHAKLRPGTLLGCTAAGVIGGAREFENEPAIAIWAAHLPGTKIETFSLHYDHERGEISGELPRVHGEKPPAFLLLADPYTIPADQVLDAINKDFPGSSAIGGLASAAMEPGQNRLFFNDTVLHEGAVGAVITGAVEIRTVVSQGCRPVGKPFVITGADNNVIQTLGGKPTMQQVQDLFASLPPADQQLFRHGIHVGRVVDEMKSSFTRGDFLIRNVVGIDQKSGAMAIGDFVRRGQTVQFHVRDAPSAHEDLRLLLEKEKPGAAAGALLFSCNGRGSHLFGKPDQDAAALREKIGEIPVAGFFAAGEIGPVGGRNFLHGFTASIAIFR